jgi:uncharacterized protein with ParB-like and HNH nuclease domain
VKGIKDTSNVTFRMLMGNGLVYEVPKFQRDYSWDQQQWDDLWNDIVSLDTDKESEHYMGYLVLQTTDNVKYYVIDGQQRLTTLSIMILAVLKCIEDLIMEGIEIEDNKKRKDLLHSSYIGFIDPETLIAKNKMILNRNNDDYYRTYMVLLKELPLRGTNASEKLMKECFNWFLERLRKRFSSGEKYAGFIADFTDKLFFTSIKVSDQLNAFKVFETLNARGVQLSSADLLKNYLFSVVDESRPGKNEIEELESMWSKLVDKLGNQKLEEYLRYFWNSSNKTVRKSNLFAEIRSKISSKEEVFRLVRDLTDTADIYLSIRDPNDEIWKSKADIIKNLKLLRQFGINQTNSLLIAGYKNLSISEFTKLTRICSVISFRYNVIGGLNPNEQEEIYNSLALSITRDKTLKIRDLESIYVSDTRFENEFALKQFKPTTRNNKIIRYILAELEEYNFKHDINPDSDIYTIEHILPESADENWGEFTDEEISRSVYRLGNLTFLESVLNREADKKAFVDKIKFYEKSNSKMTLSISSEFKNWNEDKISERQRQMAKAAKSIWRIQEFDR